MISKTGCLLLIICSSFIPDRSYGQFQYATHAMRIVLDSCNRVVSLGNFLDSISWIAKKEPLFSVEASGENKTSFRISKYHNGAIQLSLAIKNTDKDSITVGPVFPRMDGLTPTGVEDVAGNLFYLFPSQGAVADNQDDTTMEALYSGNFPMQFLDVYYKKAGGFYILCKDTTNYPKLFRLSKNKGAVDFSIKYRERKLAPGEIWILPSIELGAQKGDWHDAFSAYCNWVKEWYNPLTSRKEWFDEVFNLRQVFLHKIFGEEGSFDEATKSINLFQKVQEDKKAFGGVDYVHIFDWSTTPDAGRVGDYAPWKYLGGKDSLRKEIKKLADSGIRVGLYQEGYLISKKSEIGREKGKEWQQLDSGGLPYARFGTGYYYPCPLEKGWRDYFSRAAKNASDALGTAGVYVDEFGFGWQYDCYNPAHHHDTRVTSFSNALQVPAEAGFMVELKERLGDSKVTYGEEMPTDVSTQYQDGSFTYAVSVAGQRRNPSRVNLARFAFPDFKLFEILHVDEPMGNDTTGIKHVFFNGEGLWIEGPLSDPKWFPETTRKMIRKTYAILKSHKEAFTSLHPVPLVSTLNNDIYANYFPSEKENVWTLYNAQNDAYSGKVLRIPDVKGARYYDAWNNRYISPQILDGKAIISLSVPAKDVGCIVQELK